MTAGRKATPKDAASTERLMRYWAEGEGAAKRATGARPGHAPGEQGGHKGGKH